MNRQDKEKELFSANSKQVFEENLPRILPQMLLWLCTNHPSSSSSLTFSHYYIYTYIDLLYTFMEHYYIHVKIMITWFDFFKLTSCSVRKWLVSWSESTRFRIGLKCEGPTRHATNKKEACNSVRGNKQQRQPPPSSYK